MQLKNNQTLKETAKCDLYTKENAINGIQPQDDADVELVDKDFKASTSMKKGKIL